MITKETIANLPVAFNQVLPDGYLKRLAEKTGTSRQWIHRCLTGKTKPTQKVIHAAITELETNKAKTEALLQELRL